MNQPTATTESQVTEASTTASSDAATPSEQQTTEDKDTSLNEKALPDVQAPITDELLDSMSLAPIGGTEYSQTEVHRELNTTPVTATFQFAVLWKHRLCTWISLYSSITRTFRLFNC